MRCSDKNGGFTLVELLLFLSALFIPIFFLLYQSPVIGSRVKDYQCKKNLEQISLALHIYAAQESEHLFPKGNSAEEVFRKIFVNASIEDPTIFDDPRIPNGSPSGVPGPFFLSPSTDLTGVDFLYAKEPLSLLSDSNRIIVITKSAGTALGGIYFALHVDGQITQEPSMPSGDFIS